MAQSLVAQVSAGDDEKNRQAAAALAAEREKKKKAQKAKPHRGWCWRVFCCCCKSDPHDDDDATDSPKDTEKEQPSHDGAGSKQPAEDEPQWLMEPLKDDEKKRGLKTLVLDLDETLVHSSFTHVPDADFIIEIELDGTVHKVYVRKRPGVDEFMRAVGAKFEVVIFTASLSKYADPLLDILDKDRVVRKRLFREACVQHYGNYVKDLSLLGRKLEHSIIIDNSPFSYMFQPDNAIPITSWFHDTTDTELYQLLPLLDQLAEVEDVTTLLAQKPPQS